MQPQTRDQHQGSRRLAVAAESVHRTEGPCTYKIRVNQSWASCAGAARVHSRPTDLLPPTHYTTQTARATQAAVTLCSTYTCESFAKALTASMASRQSNQPTCAPQVRIQRDVAWTWSVFAPACLTLKSRAAARCSQVESRLGMYCYSSSLPASCAVRPASVASSARRNSSRTCMYACMRSSIHACMHPSTRACARACMHAIEYACMRSSTHVCYEFYICMYAPEHASMHSSVHVCVHA